MPPIGGRSPGTRDRVDRRERVLASRPPERPRDPLERPLRLRRRILQASVAAFVIGALWLGAGIRLFAFPAEQPLRPSDVIFVIGPIESWRINLARELIADGYADSLMVSVFQGSHLAVCDEPQTFDVTCTQPDPFTTQGEARWLRDELSENDWDSAIVITATPHVERTRYIFGRCIEQDVTVVGRSTGMGKRDWLYHFFYQTAGYLKALTVSAGC